MTVLARRPLARWWDRVDPTHPARWAAHRARGHARFLYNFGVLPLGLPLALLLDVALVARLRDFAVFFSPGHAIQLQMLVLLVGVPAGLVAGRVLWRLGERRAAEEQFTRQFDFVDPEQIVDSNSTK